MLRPQRGCSTFGICDFIRVPSPAARTMTATGRGALTRLVSSGIARTYPGFTDLGNVGTQVATTSVFTRPSPAGYRLVAVIGLTAGADLSSERDTLRAR